MAVERLAGTLSHAHSQVNVTPRSLNLQSLVVSRSVTWQLFRVFSVERQRTETLFTQHLICAYLEVWGSRGCHVVTRQIVTAVPELKHFQVGIAHLFVMHTSASLTINENASADVPKDLEDSLNRIVPEGSMYRHLDEGYDDMPAHVKSSLMGCSLTIPVSNGRLHLGTWQGIYLNEHRNSGGPRSVCVTIQGQKRVDGREFR